MNRFYIFVGQAVVFYNLGRFASKFGAAFLEEFSKPLAEKPSEPDSNS